MYIIFIQPLLLTVVTSSSPYVRDSMCYSLPYDGASYPLVPLDSGLEYQDTSSTVLYVEYNMPDSNFVSLA
jgi:hypothetical protein